jgi:hypothetical protein
MKKTQCLLTIVAAAFLCGCVSQPLKIGTPKQQNYQTLGEAEGSATGLMLFNVIPIGQNERFVQAYQQAVKSKGGDDLINAEISESWFWGYILNGYSTKIKGTVIKYQ